MVNKLLYSPLRQGSLWHSWLLQLRFSTPSATLLNCTPPPHVLLHRVHSPTWDSAVQPQLQSQLPVQPQLHPQLPVQPHICSNANPDFCCHSFRDWDGCGTQSVGWSDHISCSIDETLRYMSEPQPFVCCSKWRCVTTSWTCSWPKLPLLPVCRQTGYYHKRAERGYYHKSDIILCVK